ncbi:MAG: GcrA family cell cycle regulator [Sphingomonadales bacterium]
MAWTDEKIKKLKSLWGKGLTASQIATEIGDGISRNAVIGKAHRLKLPSRPSPVKGAPQKKVAAPEPKKEVETEATKTSLLDLTEQTCKWPIGHPGDADFYFCGKASKPGVPYCREHCKMAFQTQLPRKNRPGMAPKR